MEDLCVLSTAERERCRRFVCPEDRRDFAAAHALLRRCLSAGTSTPAASWGVETAPGGTPRLASSAPAGVDLDFDSRSPVITLHADDARTAPGDILRRSA